MVLSQSCLIIKEGVTPCSIPLSLPGETLLFKMNTLCTEESKLKKEMFEEWLGLIWLRAQRTDNLGHDLFNPKDVDAITTENFLIYFFPYSSVRE